MYTGIFDTHAHYDDERFDGARDGLLAGLAERGVSLVLNCASGLKSAETTLALAKSCGFVYAAVGVHPGECGELPADWLDRLRALARSEKVVAIGEIGLDYHYMPPERELQLDCFEKQLMLANELSLPVIIHDREAHEDCFRLVKKHRPRGVFHCYSGSAEQARQLSELGIYIGFGGAVTFKNARRSLESAAAIPLTSLLLETDCPYMAPEPFRGRLCTSDMIAYTAERLAELRGIPAQRFIDTAAQNGKRLFKIN